MALTFKLTFVAQLFRTFMDEMKIDIHLQIKIKIVKIRDFSSKAEIVLNARNMYAIQRQAKQAWK